MNKSIKKQTIKEYPILFGKFASQYRGKDQQDIRYHFTSRPVLLWGRNYWLKYEKALASLSQKDRLYILDKLIGSTKRLISKVKKVDVGWPHFEEILNEVLVYKWLLDEGKSNVHFIHEASNSCTPDLGYSTVEDNTDGFNEIKTIRFSENEYKYFESLKNSTDGRFLSLDLSPVLLKKIEETLGKALSQLWEYDSDPNKQRQITLFLNLDSEVLINLILTPSSDLEEYLQIIITSTKNGKFDCHIGQQAKLKIYTLSGYDPVEICSSL